MTSKTTDGKPTAQLDLFEDIMKDNMNSNMAMSEKTTDETDTPMKDSGVEWISIVPITWQVRRFKTFLISSNGGEVIDKSWWHDGYELLYTCQMTPMHSSFSDFPVWKRTSENDILVTRNATPYVFLPPANAIYSNVVQRIIYNSNYMNRKYLAYALQQGANAYGRALGISIPSYNMDIWKNIYIPVPPLAEQVAIASRLDSITSRIDEAVRLIDEQLVDLKDYRKALISEVVTRGVPSDSTPQPTKPTNTKWIPTIPTHWKTRKFRYLLESMESGGTPSSSYSHYYEGDIPFVAIGDMSTTRIIRETARHISKEAQYSKNLKQYPRGTTLYSIYATIGAVSQLGISACINQALLALMPKPRLLNNYFMQYVLMAIQSYAISLASSNTQKNLNAETVSNFRIPLPPLDEQKSIVNYLDQRLSALSRHEETLSRQRDDLLAYRQSIISEYVTGKRRV